MGTEKAVKQLDAHAKKRAGSFMTILGVAADITAVAALVFNKNLTVFVQMASVAGVAIGVYLLLRQWGKPVGMRVLFAIACLTAGSVVGALSLATGGQATSTANGSSSNNGSQQTNKGDGGTYVAFQFRLESNQGIDLDAGEHTQSDVITTDGPNGKVDVFMDQYGYLVVNNGSFYRDTGGPDSEIHKRCTTILAAQRSPQPQILPQRNGAVCFKTSDGKMGWLRTNDSDFNGQVYAVLNTQIW